MKHFLAIADLSPTEFNHILAVAQQLKAEWRKRGNKPILKNKTLGMVFQKPSLRTRVSFDLAMLHLGGQALYLSPNEIGLGQRESVADVARVLARYVDGIMARVFAHAHVTELAEYSRVPVINGLSDHEHPCQAMADVLTIVEHCGKLKGKRVVFLGDGNNVARSLMFACALGGAHFVCASPHGYALDDASVAQARVFAKKSGGSVELVVDPKAAARDADVLYADVWASMGQETEAATRAQVFPPYQVNAALVALAKPRAIVLHCLPAHRGLEITDEVMDGKHSVVFDQAENRMHAQKAILAILLANSKSKGKSKK
ncbi:MAG: ornithine carbamoyltransferase [Anaerolineales bacterium]|nr:ornithine carbamoyltransferase [Anaerolineales bacterium]